MNAHGMLASTRRPMCVLTVWVVAALGLGCGTLAEGGGGDEGLPSALAGPFRPLTGGEIGDLRSAPNALSDDEQFVRDPSIIDQDGDPSTLGADVFVAHRALEEDETPDDSAPTNEILRHTTRDGRTLDRKPNTVLRAERDWEGQWVGAPSAARRGSETWLYYAAAGGIGVARSSGGAQFSPEPSPVLIAADAGWDAGAVPRSPGAVALPDGSMRLFYEVDHEGTTKIGEARSDDGILFVRVGDGPALAPGSGYDNASVGSPQPTVATTPDGTARLRLYYAAVDADGTHAIALAARDALDGELHRAVAPVFGIGLPFEPREPAVIGFEHFSLIYVTQKAGRNAAQSFPAVAVGVSPALVELPPPDPE